MKRALMILLSFLLVMPTYADMDRYSRAISEEFQIHYRFDRSDIDPEYRDNRNSTELLKQHLQNVSRIDSIIIHVYSSPDGVYEYNARLARQRAAAAETLIRQLTGNAQTNAETNAQTNAPIRTVIVAENWSGLQRLVQERYTRHDRSKVLDILEAENISEATRKWRLQQLDNGYTWNYILRHYMPELRNATFITLRMKPEDPLPTLVPMCTRAVTMNPDDGPIRPKPASGTSESPVLPTSHRSDTASEYRKGFERSKLALKTNFIYDALLSPSIEAEYHFAPHWSVNTECSVAWWSRKPDHKYYQLIQASPELRYWFRSDEMWRGHYLGAFVGAGIYDLEGGAEGYQGEFVMSGLSYGYMFPIGKRFSLEAGLGIGWLYTLYEEYIPMEGHYVYTRTRSTNYVGPVKAKLALVRHIGRTGRKAGGR